MAITREQYEETVRRLEAYAQENPGGYRLRLGLLAALGYAYIFTVLAGVILIVGGLLWLGRLNWLVVKIGWILITFAALVIRALWVRFPAPEGLEVRREEAPRLFEFVGRLTKSLSAPRVHKVLLTDDYNASVWQVPRLGPLGWHRNYLVLGLPLMQALSPEHFEAVLAHEFGHLSGRHGRFGGWIYRVRQTWVQLLSRLEQDERWGSGIFRRFFEWYAPYFQAYSFVLARAQEYEADASAAKLSGARNVAEMLIDMNVKGAYLSEKYWPEIFKRADTEERPAPRVFSSLTDALRAGVPESTASLSLARALKETTTHDDTHPSLSDRLRALDFNNGNGSLSIAEDYKPAPLKETAAEHFFGERLGVLIEKLERGWAEAVAHGWRERHEYARQGRQMLEELDEKALHSELTEEEAWTRTRLTAALRSQEEALPLAKEFLERVPAHAEASFFVGQVMLEKGDEAGVPLIERAMEADIEAFIPGCETLYEFYSKAGREEEAARCQQRAREFYDKVNEAREERSGIENDSELEPHTFTPEEVEQLRSRLELYPAVAQAFLARKKLQHFIDRPIHVLGVVLKFPWYNYKRAEVEKELLEQLTTLPFPGETFVVLLSSRYSGLRRKLQKLGGALIYKR